MMHTRLHNFFVGVTAGVLVLAAAAPAFCAERPPQSGVTDWLLEIAKKYLDDGNEAEARHELSKLLLIEPNHPEALSYLAILDDRDRRRREARTQPAAAEPIASRPPAPAPPAPAAARSDWTQSRAQEPPLAPPARATAPADAGEMRSGAAPALRPRARTGTQRDTTAMRPPGPGQDTTEQRARAIDQALQSASVRRSAQQRRPPGPPSPDQLPPGVERPREATATMNVGATLIGSGRAGLAAPGRVVAAPPRPEMAAPLDADEVSVGFRAYTVEKSVEQMAEEEALRVAIDRAGRSETPEPSGVPVEARPTVELDGYTSYSYDDPKLGPPFRTLLTNIRGHVGHYDMAAESLRQDRNGVFDHDYSYLNFRSDDLYVGLLEQRTDLAPLRTQFQDFDGIKVQKIWGRPIGGQSARYASRYGVRALESFDDRLPVTTLAAGRMETTTSGEDGIIKYLGDLYEFRQQLLPLDWLALEAGAFYLESDADLPALSGTSSYPRNNLVSFASTDILLPHEFRLSGQAARASYEPDHDPDGDVTDWNWRTALAWEQEGSRAVMAYEYVGKDYASLGDPRTYQDYAGLTAFGTHRLSDVWSVSSHYLRYRDNVDENPDETFSENQAASLSTAYRLTANQSLNLNVTSVTNNPDGPEAGSSVKTMGYRADYYLPFIAGTRLLTSYQYLQNRVTVGNDLVSHTTGASIFGSFGRGSSWSVSQDARKTLNEDAPNDLSLNTSLNVSHQVTPALNTYANSTYTREAVENASGTDVLSGAVGLRYRFRPETLVGGEFEVNAYDLDTERGDWPHDWSLLFLVTQHFGFTTAPNFARISGLVFQDANANGRLDAGERPVEDAVIHLGTEQRRLTGAQGRYSFSRALPGRQEVRLDLSSTDPEWMSPEARRLVTVRAQREAQVDFPLIRGGRVSGHVFIDANGDGAFQELEEPLEGIAVVLEPAGEFRRTDADGAFVFEQIMPGDYTVSVHAEDLPGGYALVSPPRPAAIDTAEDVAGVDFAVTVQAESVQRFPAAPATPEED